MELIYLHKKEKVPIFAKEFSNELTGLGLR